MQRIILDNDGIYKDVVIHTTNNFQKSLLWRVLTEYKSVDFISNLFSFLIVLLLHKNNRNTAISVPHVFLYTPIFKYKITQLFSVCSSDPTWW